MTGYLIVARITVQLVGEGERHHAYVELPALCQAPPFIVWNHGVYQHADGVVPAHGAQMVYRQVFALCL